MENINKRNKGFSLLELLLVLGIVAALIVAAFIVYPKVKSSYNASSEAKNIALIQTVSRSLYSAQGNYSGLYTTVLTNADAIPKGMINPQNGLITNGFKGYITVIAEAINGTTNTGFMISTDSIPSAECAKIISMIGSNFYTVRVNGGNYVKNKNMPLDLNETVTQCSKLDINSIQFDSE